MKIIFEFIDDQISEVHGLEDLNMENRHHQLKKWQSLRNKTEREVLKIITRIERTMERRGEK